MQERTLTMLLEMGERASGAQGPLRPAEEIAREMVSEQDSDGWARVFGVELQMTSWEYADLRKAATGAIEQASAEGAAAERAEHAAQLCEIGAALDEARDHIHQVAARSLESPVSLVRVALHRAAEALAAQQPGATDLVVGRVRDDGSVVLYRDGVPVGSGRVEEQPRDSAGRIRALVMEYAGRWCDAVGDAAVGVENSLAALRFALAAHKRGGDVQNHILWMKQRTCQYTRRAADELEAIVRECGEEKRS
jgi:hypothetical protein